MKKTLALALFTAACHHMSPEQAMAHLHDPDPTARQHAADALRSENMSPQEVQALLEAVRGEQELKARAAMMISLGASGAQEAKPVIDDYVMRAQSFDEQKYAGRALKYWMWKTGGLPKDYAFPEGWPYGTAGFPPRAAKGE